MTTKSGKKKPHRNAGTSGHPAHKGQLDFAEETGLDERDSAEDEDIVPQGKLVCALTKNLVNDTPEEQTLQSFIDQLEREYGVSPDAMERDVVVEVVFEEGDKERRKKRKVSLAVYEQGQSHATTDHVIRVVMLARAGTKPDDKAIAQLEDVLASIAPTYPQVFGLWTNGEVMEFRMREFGLRRDEKFTPLTDFPAPDESLEDLEKAERRPLRVATRDSLVRTFKRCHDYLYGNKSIDSKKAFWQLLQLIFCKIHDEQQSSKMFFVGATEPNTDAGLNTTGGRAEGRDVGSSLSA